jgi:hypothetical protein
MSRGIRPKITWGAAFANTWVFATGTFLSMPDSYPQPAEGSSFLKLESGVEDSYVSRTDEFIAGDVRHLIADPSGGVTGWNGAATSGDGDGVRDFLTWARAKNVFRFFPDQSSGTYVECYLAEPMDHSGIEFDQAPYLRRFRLVMRVADDTPFTGY